MTFNELRYIIAVAKYKHFGKAARACHISQPALSVAVNKFEKSLGIVIFERISNDIQVTPIGHKIIAQAKRVLAEVTTIEMLAQQSSSQLDSELQIGAIFTIAPFLFPKLVPALIKVAPEMPLIIQESYTHVLTEKLLTAELDAIIVSSPFEESGIVTNVLYEEPLVILMPKHHPLAQLKKVPLTELAKYELLLLGEGHCLRRQILEACPECVVSGLQKTVEGTSLQTLIHMVASGFGITVIPATCTLDYSSSILCTRAFSGVQPTRQAILAWRMSYPRTKAIDALMKAAKRG